MESGKSSSAALSGRIPPGQQLVAPGKWPVIGERASAPHQGQWTLRLDGLFQAPVVLSWDALLKLPQTTLTTDIHCVTRWSKLDVTFTGVMLSDLLAIYPALPEARYVSFVAHSVRHHSTSLPLEEAIALGTLLAWKVEDRPLEPGHGGPLRGIVPGKYFYKSVKWLCRLELLRDDRLGFWEAESGYHNGAAPWQEQRYMAPTIDRRLAAQLIASRDFSGRDLRSIDATRRDLKGLKAVEALLRDAKFDHADLREADFTRANLSNAHLRHADLRQARLVNADLEGADLVGADLRGADMTGCSLIGSSFCEWDPQGHGIQGAIIDGSTCLPEELLDPLTPEQFDYVRSQLG